MPRFTREQAARALRWARNASGMTQEAAGRAVGVTRQTIAGWEQKKPPAAAYYVLLLARSRPASRIALLAGIGVTEEQQAGDHDPEVDEIIARLHDVRATRRWPDARAAIDALLNGMDDG